jgi:NAD(P)-dependent dehydrogenase (short-subunit alcohol dehydrogenase family)
VSEEKQLAGRVAIVTGGGRGLGRAMTLGLAGAGAAVVATAARERGEVERVAAEAAKAGAPDGVIAMLADVTREDDCARVVAAALERFGRLDVLVNNAGISRVIPHADLDAAIPDVWHELYEVNVVAPFRLVSEAQSALRDAAARGRPGCVVNVSSHAGVRPKGASIPYAATKAALNHVTRLLAVSLAPDIRVNAVAPGLVDTPLTANWTQAQQLWKERAPMRRAASPEDIAQAVALLVASDYLTGEILLSDGGLNLT